MKEMTPVGYVHRMREEVSKHGRIVRKPTEEDLAFLSVFFDDLGVRPEDGSPVAGENFKRFTRMKEYRVGYEAKQNERHSKGPDGRNEHA